jgi:hypothetical protein
MTDDEERAMADLERRRRAWEPEARASVAASIGGLVRSVAGRLGARLEVHDGLPRRPEAPPDRVHADRWVSARFAALRQIPERHAGARFGTPELARFVADRRAIERAREVADDPKGHPFVVLVGPSDAGKTSLATAVYAVRAERLAAGVWAKADRAITEARECKIGTIPPLLARCRETRNLLLDDLGQEPEGDVQRSQIYDLLDEREAAGLSTIITSGMLRAQLQARYGEGLVNRLVERGTAIELRPRPRKA